MFIFKIVGFLINAYIVKIKKPTNNLKNATCSGIRPKLISVLPNSPSVAQHIAAINTNK